MNKHAIYHITDTPFAYGLNEDTLRVRLRTAREDLKVCKIYYKDRYDWDNGFVAQDMKLENSTELFDYYYIDICVSRNRYRYYFELVDKNGNECYLDDRGLREKKMERAEATSYQYPYIAKADVYKEVKWLQEAIVYQIFVDRFCNGDKSNDPKGVLPWGDDVTSTSMFGGDLRGIIDKLDYLKELGVDLLYLTPIFKSSSNHKYNTCDYYEIDEQFGTVDDAKELVKGCHDRGIKIVFDAVFNHSGYDFFAFQDLVKNGEKSKYKDWYFVDSYPIDKEKINYYTFANDVYDMPKFDTSNEEVKNYLIEVGKYWVKEVDIDGWRLDVCDEVDHDFWKDFKHAVKGVKEDAIIVGEIMHEATSFLKGDQIDSIMNYPFKGAMIDFFANRTIDVEKFSEVLAQNRSIYMESINKQLWNLIGSHDTKRFLTECDGDVERMKLAIIFQFCYLGVPYIYYGDEVGLDGGEEPQSRKCMIWDEEKSNKFLYSLYRQIIKIRKENKELIYGTYKNLYADKNVIVFERKYNDEKVIVAINNSTKDVVVTIKDDLDLYNLHLKSMDYKIYKNNFKIQLL